jgi:hypothetical protein
VKFPLREGECQQNLPEIYLFSSIWEHFDALKLTKVEILLFLEISPSMNETFYVISLIVNKHRALIQLQLKSNNAFFGVDRVLTFDRKKYSYNIFFSFYLNYERLTWKIRGNTLINDSYEYTQNQMQCHSIETKSK